MSGNEYRRPWRYTRSKSPRFSSRHDFGKPNLARVSLVGDAVSGGPLKPAFGLGGVDDPLNPVFSLLGVRDSKLSCTAGLNGRLLAETRLHGDALAALRSPARQHGAPTLGLHALAEAMRLRPAPPVRLKSTFRHEKTAAPSLVFMRGSQSLSIKYVHQIAKLRK